MSLWGWQDESNIGGIWRNDSDSSFWSQPYRRAVRDYEAYVANEFCQIVLKPALLAVQKETNKFVSYKI